MRKLIFIVLILTGLSSVYSSPITTGEELYYKITYMGIKLADANIKTQSTDYVNGSPCYVVKANLNTPPGMPFVDARINFTSYTEQTLNRSRQFIRHMSLMGGEWEYQKLFFNYSGSRILNKKWIKKQLMHTSRHSMEGSSRIHDLISLAFMIRSRSYQKAPYSAKAIIDAGVFDVRINQTGSKESVEIGAVDHPVRCRHVSGNANWKMYGMTGFAEAWFSDDDARIPVKAYIDLKIGKAKVELVRWKRAGWKPPYGN